MSFEQKMIFCKNKIKLCICSHLSGDHEHFPFAILDILGGLLMVGANLLLFVAVLKNNQKHFLPWMILTMIENVLKLLIILYLLIPGEL